MCKTTDTGHDREVSETQVIIDAATVNSEPIEVEDAAFHAGLVYVVAAEVTPTLQQAGYVCAAPADFALTPLTFLADEELSVMIGCIRTKGKPCLTAAPRTTEQNGRTVRVFCLFYRSEKDLRRLLEAYKAGRWESETAKETVEAA